jgi:phosphatidylglycerophosphate synthase
MLEKSKPTIGRLLSPLLSLLHALRARPNQITSAGIIIGVLALISYYYNFIISIIFFAIAFLCDLLDGAYARKYKMTTKFGAIYDSLMDRIVEMLFILIIAVHTKEYELGLIMLGLSPLISYTKHLALEQELLKEKHTIFDRGERLIYLIVLLIINSVTTSFTKVLMILFIVLSLVALAQLLLRIRRAAHSSASH